MTAPKIATSSFDTRAFAPKERFKLWRDSIDVIFESRLDPSFDETEFHARVDACVLGQVLLGCVSSNTQAFHRPMSKIMADGMDAYMVQVFTRGHCEVSDGRNTRVVRPGDIYIIDASATLDAINFDFSHTTAIIPRAALAPMLVSPDLHHKRIIPHDLPLAKVLYDFILSLGAQSARMTVDDAFATQAPLLSFVQTVLNANPSKTPASLSSDTVDLAAITAIKAYITANLGNPSLNPDDIAAAHGMSRSRLYRLMQNSGGVAEEILRQRLRFSLRDLLNQNGPQPRIAELAFRWGFGSESAFIRAFKRAYTLTPGEAKQARSTIPRSSDEMADSYEDWILRIAI